MPRFQSNGASLYYSVDGEGPPVVMLHCLPMDHRVWVHQVFELSPAYRTIALDFRGLGLSDRITGSCSIKGLSEDVNNLMRHEGIDQAIVMGISIGGHVAQQFALDHPNKVRALVLTGTSSSSKSEALQNRFSNFIANYRSNDPELRFLEHVKYLFSKEYASSLQGMAVISSYVSSAKRNKIDFESIARLLEAVKESDRSKDVGNISAPTIVIVGDKDAALENSKNLSRSIRNSKFTPIPGAGHAVCIEDPVNYNKVLLQFLEGK